MLSQRVPSFLFWGVLFLIGTVPAGSWAVPSPANVCDCPPGIEEVEPSRIVAQIIDNTFCQWAEYDFLGDEGQIACCLVMDRPEHKQLSAEEAQALLAASSEWYQPGSPGAAQSAPVVPEISAPAAASVGGNNLRIETVCNSDDRIRVENTQAFPWNTLCCLDLQFPDGLYGGTGTLIGPYTILTAGHALYDYDHHDPPAWVQSIVVAPGQYEDSLGGKQRPHPAQTAADFAAEPRWLEGKNRAYDYGAIFVSTPFSGISTYMPVEFEASTQNLQAGQNVFVAGYPNEYPAGTPTDALYYAQGPILSVDPQTVTYATDTSGGQSGGPVYRFYGATRRIVAVHSAGSDPALSSCYNRAARLRAENLDLIRGWMQWQPSDEEDGIPRLTGALQTGNIWPTGEVDWWYFTVAYPSTLCVIEAILETLPDSILELYGPNSQTTKITENDDITWGTLASKISLTLSPGKYYVKVFSYRSNSAGAYKIRLTTSSPYEPVPPGSIIGTWRLHYHWGTGTFYGTTDIVFYSNGRFASTSDLNVGTWTQSGNSVSWTYENGTHYKGTMDPSNPNLMSGTGQDSGGGFLEWNATREKGP